MGCRESKIKKINLLPPTSETDGHISTISNGKTNGVAPIANGNGHRKVNDSGSEAPSRLLSAIPISDLGDSLDSRLIKDTLLRRPFNNFLRFIGTLVSH